MTVLLMTMKEPDATICMWVPARRVVGLSTDVDGVRSNW